MITFTHKFPIITKLKFSLENRIFKKIKREECNESYNKRGKSIILVKFK